MLSVAPDILLFAVVWILAGCAQSGQMSSRHHYALGVMMPPATYGAQTQNDNGKVLGLAPIAVAPWLAGTGMYYRLAYKQDNRLFAYSYSDWVAPPAGLLESVIQNALAANSGWQAVIGPGTPAAVDAGLHLRLENFSQVFTQPKQSVGIVEMTATLIGRDGEQVLAQQDFRVQVVAPTPDAQGGVKALGRASRQLATRLQRWLRAIAATAR